mmetsp:Transcript_9777/g.32045  ORF Transcript_9777/g.32045 Transcript_9777/m.32045 type:complete len:233 (+) Transcript_9777:299-997(+)
MQHPPDSYAASRSGPESAPIASLNGPKAIGSCRPSTPTAAIAAVRSRGSSGSSPPALAAAQLTTEKEEPRSTIALSALPLRCTGAARSPDGMSCSSFTARRLSVSHAPLATDPTGQNTTLRSTKSSSISYARRKLRPMSPPTEGGRPTLDARSTTIASIFSISTEPANRTPSSVICCRTVTPPAAIPCVAFPEKGEMPSESRSADPTSVWVAPESRRKSVSPTPSTSSGRMT